MMAYVLDRTPWMRMAMLALAVPVAIAANAIRVAASASLPALDSGLPHAAAGFAIFLACLAALLSGRWLLRAVTVRMHA
jgi:exosortase/archaeosortase family protein